MEQLVLDLHESPRGKVCTRCGIWKPLNEFRNNKMGRHGKRSLCKDCDKVYQQEYYVANQEIVLEKNRERYHANIEQERVRGRKKHAKYGRKYYLENHDKMLERAHLYRVRNPDKIRTANQ